MIAFRTDADAIRELIAWAAVTVGGQGYTGHARAALDALEGKIAALTEALDDIAEGRWDEKRTDASQSPSEWARERAAAALERDE